MLAALVVLSLLSNTKAHASLKWPPSWYDPKGAIGLRTGFKNDACSAGCGKEEHFFESNFNVLCSCMWYEQESLVPAGTVDILPGYMSTIPETYKEIEGMAPARAPGRGAISSPCGLMGGLLQSDVLKEVESEGYDEHLPTDEIKSQAYGRDARAHAFQDVVTTEWAAGSVVEVGFGMNAQHGGVYSYRLCKHPTSRLNLTEDCFQQGALAFHGTEQWFQFGAEKARRRNLTASRWVDPETNIEWSRLPIPSCSNHAGYVCDGPLFDPPYGIYGYGGENMDGFQLNVMDALKLPADLDVGEYVLSFRWDVEDGGQVWLQCANVRIVSSDQSPVPFLQPPLPKEIKLLTRFRKGGPMSLHHCEAWCSADDNCLAFEREIAKATCYHFYTLDFDNAVSHVDWYYEQLGDTPPTTGERDWTKWHRFLKKNEGGYTKFAEGSNEEPIASEAHRSFITLLLIAIEVMRSLND
eukprot:gnl/TRDRNA2_/TRDRNA2_164055_c0_seq1.p1 gnl/TRDRNA2_/TRDRNA2_164055_c0~~gnl/TRDRNA2_/TRDRNA2_164055_c0_seq1.p1  ORF type:complete len:489 (-),score=62.81 gnl/TRDRNA2_/TRDRNA2_164055_c0_seq1:49-1449(-)